MVTGKMNKTIIINCITSIILAGCAAPAARQPATEGIKIGELAPKGKTPNQPVIQLLQTTNIDVITYELPVKDINALDNVWAILAANPESLRITDQAGFAANGLRIEAGKFGQKNKITDAMERIKANKLTVSLLIQNDQPEMLVLGQLTRKMAITYIGRGGTAVDTEAGPATLGLQVYARQITPPRPADQTNKQAPPARTISRVQITPIISVSTDGLPEELAMRLKQTDVRIYSASFGLNMKPGDIFLLAPKPGKINDQTAVAGRFFTRNGTEPKIKILLFICTSIT